MEWYLRADIAKGARTPEQWMRRDAQVNAILAAGTAEAKAASAAAARAFMYANWGGLTPGQRVAKYLGSPNDPTIQNWWLGDPQAQGHFRSTIESGLKMFGGAENFITEMVTGEAAFVALVRLYRLTRTASKVAETLTKLKCGGHAPKDPMKAQKIIDEIVKTDFPEGFFTTPPSYNPRLYPAAGSSRNPLDPRGPLMEIGRMAFGKTPAELRYTLTHEELHFYLWGQGVPSPHHVGNPVIDTWMRDFVAQVFKSRGWKLPRLQ